MLRRFIPIALSLMLVMTMAPYSMAGSTDGSTNGSTAEKDLAAFAQLEEEDYAPGEAIVVFREGAVKDRAMSLAAAKKLDETGSEFGDMMAAAGEEAEAAADARSEVSIIRESLGDDFTIRDTIAFDEELTMCLVASKKYDTEELIKRLSENQQIKSVEANTYLEPESYDYSLNDQLAQYAYHVNSPADSNTAGRNVCSRGTDPDKAVSLRAGAVSDFGADHSAEDEVVVAVLDSGINTTHEDLKNMMWTNPGDIGLEGEHGFNFDDNSPLIEDRHGHGTHCSGIIAAQANNGKGVAGVASGVNVKIMMCAISGSIIDENGEYYQSEIPSTFRRIGAMNYVLKAKQKGVNVVATSNSWGSPDQSDVFDETIDKLGEAGILSFVAASNESTNIDQVHYAPVGGDSPYMITVGSVDITGKPAGYSNYGKAYVDLFAPGHNIYSTSAWSIYSPSMYTAAERAENTEYYGAFNSSVTVGAEAEEELGTNRVVPSTDGEGVSAFGPARFFKQKAGQGDEGDEPADPEEPGQNEEPTDPDEPAADDAPESSCELSISEDRFFANNCEPGSDIRPASLKVTIHNARVGEEYYIYFPYAKNHATTGADNTRYSITTLLQHKKEEFCASIKGGEILKHDKDGAITMSCLEAEDLECTSQNDGCIENITCGGRVKNKDALSSWADSDPDSTDVKETGIGLCITPTARNEAPIADDIIDADEIRDITIYIDSLGVSRPVTEEGKTPEDLFPKDSSYELMSGTSMACPAAAGAYAVLTSLYPAKAGQTGSDYAMESRARLFSLVRQSDSLKDLCSTGGYLDLSLIDNIAGQASISDAVCDVKKGTLTLHGTGLTDDLKLSCKSLADSEAVEEPLPSGSMKVSFAEDGKSLTISGAKPLFGRYLEFDLKKGDEVKARGAFFTVKGQNAPEKVLTEEHKEAFGKEDQVIAPRQLLTDTAGKSLYAYQANSYSLYEETAGVLYKYDGAKFVQYPGTMLKDALFDHYEKELGYDRHQITRNLAIKAQLVRQPVYENNVLYDFVSTEYTPYLEAEEEKIEKKTYLASLNYTARSPEWTFREVPSIEETYDGEDELNTNDVIYCAMDGKIYCFGPGADSTFAYALDIEKGSWEKMADLAEASLKNVNAYYNEGKIWLMFGSDGAEPSRAVYSFDGAAWKKVAEIPFVARSKSASEPPAGSAAPVKGGFILFDYSVDGGGNVSFLDTASGKITPLYYTICSGLSDPCYAEGGASVIETADGLYYCRMAIDTGQIYRIELYQVPKTSYAYTPRYKSANPMKVTKKKVKVKAKALKKKAVSKNVLTVKGAKGAVTYKIAKIKCSKKLLKAAKKKIKINKKTGKVTIRKGLKKGKYTVTVKVRAKGDLIYKPAARKATFRIIVR